MARNRYRSQPNLQRSGAHAPRWLMALGAVAVVAVGSAVMQRAASHSPPPVRLAVAAPVRAQPAPPPAPIAAPMPAQARSAPAQTAPVGIAPVPVAPEARAVARPKAPPTTPQQAWRRRQQAFVLARQAYDRRERAEGFRWAQQNHVAEERYCRATRQRTLAFMAGCLEYLGRSDGPERSA